MSRKLLNIEFDSAGHMVQFAYGRANSKTEVGNDFSEEMTYSHMYHSSKPRVWFVSSKGRKYCMFLDAFDEIIRANKFADNKVSGTFRFEKRGTAQSIKLVLEKPPTP